MLAAALALVLRRCAAVSRRTACGIAVACALLWAGNAVLTSWFWVDVLCLDAWESVALVERDLNGSLSVADLLAPHNEHRPLTGRLVALAAARTSGWNHWWEFACLHLVAAIQILLLAMCLGWSRTWRIQPVVLVAVVAWFCSTMHWETWLRGFSVHILVGVLAPIAALSVLCQRVASWRSIGVAVVAVLVGQVSFAAALLTWPLGAMVIVVRRQDGWPAHLAAWVSIGVVATALYVPGLQVHPSAGANLALTLSPWGLLRVAAGVLVTLGMGVYYAPSVFEASRQGPQVVVIVMAGLAVLAWCAAIVRRWRQDEVREYAWLFPAMFGAFGLGACLMASAGRVYGGLLAMAASRYLIFAACFWSSLVWLLALHRGPRANWRAATTTLVSAAAVVAMIAASVASIPQMASEQLRVEEARDLLLRGDVGAAAFVLYPDPHKLQYLRDVLYRHRLSLFRDAPQGESVAP